MCPLPEIDKYIYRPKHIIFTKSNDNYHEYLYKHRNYPKIYEITLFHAGRLAYYCVYENDE